MTWRHLNFFQHHCYVTAPVPRVRCAEHGVKRIEVPWARAGSRFTLLFEQAALALAREMPVEAAARQMEITDKRLWRVVQFYVHQAVARMDLSPVRAVAFDETAARRGHRYVTVFIDLDRRDTPVLFATPGKGKACVHRFRAFLEAHGGKPGAIAEVVCDMSRAFQTAVGETFPDASLTVDWFHVVQLFTDAVDAVRRSEARQTRMPKGARWATLKAGDRPLKDRDRDALAELERMGLATAEAYKIKEKLRWVRKAATAQAARWRLTHFLNLADRLVAGKAALEPVVRAIATVRQQIDAIIRRWISTHSNARLEGLNAIFQAARARARGYSNPQTFIAMIYLLAAPIGDITKST
jgi:transposase